MNILYPSGFNFFNTDAGWHRKSPFPSPFICPQETGHAL